MNVYAHTHIFLRKTFAAHSGKNAIDRCWSYREKPSTGLALKERSFSFTILEGFQDRQKEMCDNSGKFSFFKKKETYIWNTTSLAGMY